MNGTNSSSTFDAGMLFFALISIHRNMPNLKFVKQNEGFLSKPYLPFSMLDIDLYCFLITLPSFSRMSVDQKQCLPFYFAIIPLVMVVAISCAVSMPLIVPIAGLFSVLEGMWWSHNRKCNGTLWL